MDKTNYVTKMLWEHIENSKTKIAKRVYNCMNYDIFSVILDKDTFWFEKTYSEAIIPKFVSEYAIRFYQKKGYKYLYN
jgi:hypothetical protein